LELTPLERDLLERFHARYAAEGFPRVDELVVLDRDDFGAGRCVRFLHHGFLHLSDGELGLGRYSQINVPVLEAGASFHARIERGKLADLEIFVNGDGPWDGSETGWTVCDPDTGEFPEDAARG